MVRLVAKGYTQIPGRDYDETYSPVMDAITYRFLIAFALQHNLEMHLMDVITAYLYGILDTEIYMIAPPELIKRVSFHIEGEKTRTLSQDLQSGLRQIVPTGDLKCQMATKGSSVQQTGYETLGGPNVQPKPKRGPTVTPLTQHSQKGLPVQKKNCVLPTQARNTRPSAHSKVPTKNSARKRIQKYAVKVLRSINGLKQSGRIWYKRFRAEMLNLDFINDDLAPCLFLKQVDTEFLVLALYVDDVNIFGTPHLVSKTIQKLKGIFDMKLLGKPNLCLGIQFEYLKDGILITQSTYTRKILKKFNMDKAHPVTTPMELRSLNADKDMFKKRQEFEEVLGSEKPYLSGFGTLMYLANPTRPDIAFAVNLLARHSSEPTIRHWNGIKRIFRYLNGTQDLGLYFPRNASHDLVGYTDAGYLSDPTDAKSQTGYVFLQGPTAVSWKSQKQTLTATSSNHSEIIALYEATRECIWLRKLFNHINSNTGRPLITKPTVIFEDNKPCVDQIQ